jgi:hypothetical protein
MPQVSDRVLDPPITPEEVLIARQAFVCQGERFVVTVLEGCSKTGLRIPRGRRQSGFPPFGKLRASFSRE